MLSLSKNNSPSFKNDLIQEINKNLLALNEKDILNIANLIYKNKDQNIFFMGVGKSENFGNHMADMLKSLGYKAFNMNHTNCLHGDLGCIKENNLIFAISKSGKSSELLKPLNIIKQKKTKVIGLFCKDNTELSELCDYSVILPLSRELDPNFNLVPTTSFIIYSSFLALLIRHLFELENIGILDYGHNHPAGSIGSKIFRRVCDSMIPKNKIPIYYFSNLKNIDIYDIMNEIDIKKVGIVCFLDDKDELIGILTNGLIIKYLKHNSNKKIDLRQIIEYNPIVIENQLNTRIDDLKLEINHIYFPIIQDKKLVGIFYNISANKDI